MSQEQRPAVRNVLFIMCDQLRADYLSCYGHPHLQTPSIDALAARGTRFEHAYVQAPVCGPSRMSCYTGRYMASHGATWNYVPLPAGERTLGDYLRPHGIRTAVAGKTHVAGDVETLRRLGVDPTQGIGRLVCEGGFEPYARDDGLHPDNGDWSQLAYNVYLNQQGYRSKNPWHDFANSALGPNGEVLSGWHMRNARLPARVQEEHSETAYTTDRAIDFIREQGERPWCLHLSFIKPHWPYIAPAPYHKLFGEADCLPVLRHERERNDPHPVHAAFMEHEESVSFSREDVRRAVIPTYMGLIRQIDDRIGRLMAFLEKQGRLHDTLIVFTSDHGDLLGDHWLGEKEAFFEGGIRVPLIVCDPSADKKGQVRTDIVESIDLVPTFLDALGLPPQHHRLEGESLRPLIHGHGTRRGDQAICEFDYSFYDAARKLNLAPHEARAVMVRTAQWKYVHYDGFRAQLFDLLNDPDEMEDLGAGSGHRGVRGEMRDRLFQWTRDRRNRTTMSDEDVIRFGDRTGGEVQVIIGRW